MADLLVKRSSQLTSLANGAKRSLSTQRAFGHPADGDPQLANLRSRIEWHSKAMIVCSALAAIEFCMFVQAFYRLTTELLQNLYRLCTPTHADLTPAFRAST